MNSAWGVAVNKTAFGAVVVSLAATVLAAIPGHAETPEVVAAAPPPPGFVSRYEITQTLRAAGFHLLGPPLREGTNYVLRAADFRGILMRVVVDAHTGAIRAANRIVPGPGYYSEAVVTPPGYGYAGPPGFYGPTVSELPNREEASLPSRATSAAPLVSRPLESETAIVPLPRPRPKELTAQKPLDRSKPSSTPSSSTLASPSKPPAPLPLND
jgi:hypothetical protein